MHGAGTILPADLVLQLPKLDEADLLLVGGVRCQGRDAAGQGAAHMPDGAAQRCGRPPKQLPLARRPLLHREAAQGGGSKPRRLLSSLPHCHKPLRHQVSPTRLASCTQKDCLGNSAFWAGLFLRCHACCEYTTSSSVLLAQAYNHMKIFTYEDMDMFTVSSPCAYAGWRAKFGQYAVARGNSQWRRSSEQS